MGNVQRGRHNLTTAKPGDGVPEAALLRSRRKLSARALQARARGCRGWNDRNNTQKRKDSS